MNGGLFILLSGSYCFPLSWTRFLVMVLLIGSRAVFVAVLFDSMVGACGRRSLFFASGTGGVAVGVFGGRPLFFRNGADGLAVGAFGGRPLFFAHGADVAAVCVFGGRPLLLAT